MGDNYRTPLITAAIEMAARNLDLPADAIFHSDRGSNYTSGQFAAVLERLGIRQSVGRTGICFDNALAESFNAALKVERVHRTVYLREGRRAKTSPVTSRSGIIACVFIQRSGTGPRKRPTTSI
jgi:transposase InsO family protein